MNVGNTSSIFSRRGSMNVHNIHEPAILQRVNALLEPIADESTYNLKMLFLN